MNVALLIRNLHVPPMTAVTVVPWCAITNRHKLFLWLRKHHILPATGLISSGQQPTHAITHTD